MAAAWKMLAARYDTNATVVGADLFNEPHKGCAGGDIAAMYEKVGAGVRAGSARMMLLYEDNAYESYMAQGFEMDRQPNLTNAVYSWHIYAHCWVATDCTTPGQQPMQDHLTRANSWGVPLWIGETDAMNATRAGTDLTDAEKPDLKLMMDYFKANDISWTLWGYDNGCCTVVYPSGSHTAKPALINFLQPYMQPWPLGTPTPTPPPALGLHITGNHLVNEKGQSTRLFGINRSTANACVSSNSVFQGPADAASVAQLSNWNINAVRITMNEDCWLGINGAPAATSGANYRTAIQNYISLLHAQGYYAIIDLHFNAPGANLAVTQQDMADADHSLTYWTSVANAFKSDPGVIFEPYNEPDVNTSNSNATAPWTCWLHGCTVNRLYSDFYNQTYTASSWQSTGMQNIVDAIRATGATNVITLGGLGTSHDLSGLLANLPSDPLHQLAATFHNYQRAVVGGYGCDSTCWGTVIAPIAQQMPVLTDELGQSECQTNYSDFVTQYMNWADSHGVSYFPWGWFVYTGSTTGCTSDHQYDLLSNSNGTPNYYGQVFVNHFAQVNGGGSPSPTPTPPPTSPPPTPSPSPSCAPIVGNLNSDCVVNFTDLSILLTQWGTAGPSADLNHDGTVNLFDLSILLSHWTG